MTFRSALFALLATGPLLVAGVAYATSTYPAAQARRPAPQRPVAAPPRKPAAPRPVAIAVAAPAPAVVAPVPAVIAAAPQPAAAPQLLSVSGTILGTDGQPRAGVSVFPTFNPRLIAVTDAKGAFSLRLPTPAGSFHLQTDYFGVGGSRVEVDGQHPQPITIVLGQ